jgi:hypothetical protein
VSIGGQPTSGLGDHRRVDVDGGGAGGAEHIQFAGHAFTGATTDIQDLQAIGSAPELDE